MNNFVLNPQTGSTVQAILNALSPVQSNNNLASLGYAYGTCSTAGATAAKTVAISNYVLKAGGIVSVLFSNAFEATSPTLNVNSTGAKSIYLYGSAIAPGKVPAGTVLTMMFDGTVFNVLSIESKRGSAVPGAVDLGLPSGLLWCDHNVGADSPEEFGHYFSWGNVTGHAEGSGYDFSQANYDESAGAALTGDIAVGDTYDMARKNMGGLWRLPSKTDFQELYNNCDSIWTAQDGVNGRRFTSRANGNSIFFPAAGHYDGTTLDDRGSLGLFWSSSFYSATRAYYLLFNSADVGPQNNDLRRNGFTARAVQ